MSDNDNFTLKNSNEITRKLNLLLKQNSLLTVSFNEGKSFFISTLISIDLKKKQLHLDSASDKKINQQLYKASNILFEAKVGGVQVSFTLAKISKPLLGKSTEIILAFPSELIWLERRLFYRVKAPIQNTPSCQFTLINSASTEELPLSVVLDIYDISLTGFSFIYHPDKFGYDIFADIQNIKDCTIILPGVTKLSIDVEIRNQHPLKVSAPEKVQIIGLKFAPLTSAYESQIQRYLLSVERSRMQ